MMETQLAINRVAWDRSAWIPIRGFSSHWPDSLKLWLHVSSGCLSFSRFGVAKACRGNPTRHAGHGAIWWDSKLSLASDPTNWIQLTDVDAAHLLLAQKNMFSLENIHLSSLVHVCAEIPIAKHASPDVQPSCARRVTSTRRDPFSACQLLRKRLSMFATSTFTGYRIKRANSQQDINT